MIWRKSHFIWSFSPCKYYETDWKKLFSFYWPQIDTGGKFLRWPFDWKTPIGFLIAFTIEFAADIYTQIWLILNMGFFISLCWLSIAFSKDIANDLNFLNFGGASNHRQARLIRRFCGTIQLYADARQLAHWNWVSSKMAQSEIIRVFFFFQYNWWIQPYFRFISNCSHFVVRFVHVHSTNGNPNWTSWVYTCSFSSSFFNI